MGNPGARARHVDRHWKSTRLIEHSKGIPSLEQPGEFNHALIRFLEAVVREP